MTSKWSRVVKNYPNKFGPTIPFILGAVRQPGGNVRPPDASREELRTLLVAMRDDAPDGYHVVIQGCANLGEPIVRLTDAPSGSLRFDSPSKKGRALYFESFYGLPVTDFESLVDELWNRYGESIDKGLFSRRNGEWQAFDETELAKLKSSCDIE